MLVSMVAAGEVPNTPPGISPKVPASARAKQLSEARFAKAFFFRAPGKGGGAARDLLAVDKRCRNPTRDIGEKYIAPPRCTHHSYCT